MLFLCVRSLTDGHISDITIDNQLPMRVLQPDFQLPSVLFVSFLQLLYLLLQILVGSTGLSATLFTNFLAFNKWYVLRLWYLIILECNLARQLGSSVLVLF